jgi:hypothetical protein
MTVGSLQTSAASDPLQHVIVNHDMASFKMTNVWEDLTRSYQPFTQTTVFSHSRLEQAGPFYKRRVPYSDCSTYCCKADCNLKPPLFSHVVAYRRTCSLGQCFPNFFARGPILASKNSHPSPNPCSSRYKYSVRTIGIENETFISQN